MLNGTRCTFKARAADTDGAYTVMEAVQPPRNAAHYHVHHRDHEAVFVLEGELEVHVDGDVRRLGPGGFAHAPPGVPHSLSNPSDQPNRLLSYFTPGGVFEQLVIEMGRPVAPEEPVTTADPPADMRAFLATCRGLGIELVPSEEPGSQSMARS